ncbi:MAG: hypothetical protein KF706_05180 [Chitinophagales bacterium]|nr:hypothetical protein [Chitinophagales bacterium]OJV29131.1 MAG: hypothetical protein BGO32_07485 [Bacteroidetes bacterium 37-13]
MLRVAHILNPVAVNKNSDLYYAQPITFESMRRAKLFVQDKVQVEFLSVQYEEDEKVVPEYFTKLPNLQRSVRDVSGFEKVKKFPLIADILLAAYNNSSAEYIIYTNTDITVVPHFYEAAAALIAEGYDAVTFSRRRIENKWTSIEDLPLALAEMGKLHPGYDCFILHRSLIPKFILSNICIGTGFVSVALIHNLIAFADKPLITDKLHLTVHLGLEVMPPLEQNVYRFTRSDYEQNILPKIKPLLQLHKFPYSALPWHKRMVKWMLNPNFSTQILVELEGKNFRRKIKGLIDEVRFSMLGK